MGWTARTPASAGRLFAFDLVLPRLVTKPADRDEQQVTSARDAAVSDERLMVAFASGDEQAFRTLFARHAQAALAFLVASTGSREAAEDLLQETFARVFRHRLDWRRDLGETDSFRAWLFAIARNLARDASRRAAVRRKVAEEPERVLPPRATPTTPQQEIEHEHLARDLTAALAELPEAQREAFVLARLRELSFEEVAAALGTTVGAAKMRVARATATLAARLGAHIASREMPSSFAMRSRSGRRRVDRGGLDPGPAGSHLRFARLDPA